MALFLAVIAVSCGCSDQKTLARHFGQADRVLVTDRSDPSFAMPLTAEEKQKLVEAISTARKEGPIDASAALKVEFFRGTNLLGTVDMGITERPDRVGVFGIERVPYSDKTGVFEMLGEKFRQAQATNRVVP